MPSPSPGDLPHLGIEHKSPVLAGGFLTTEPPGKPSRDNPSRVIYIGHVPLLVRVSVHPSHRLDYYMSRALLVTRATKVNKDPDH